MNYEIVFDNGFWERVATFENKCDAKKSLKAIIKKDVRKCILIPDYKIRRIKKDKQKDMKFEIVFENGNAWEKIAESVCKSDAKLILKTVKKLDKKDENLSCLKYEMRKIKNKGK